MLGTRIRRMLGRPHRRIYVVIGEQVRECEEPDYSTHPDSFYFSYDKEQLSPTSTGTIPTGRLYQARNSSQQKKRTMGIKVFSESEDAVKFAYCCNIASVVAVTYDWYGAKWEKSADQSAFDIEW